MVAGGQAKYTACQWYLILRLSNAGFVPTSTFTAWLLMAGLSMALAV